MPEIKSREANPIPGVSYSEIHLPNEKNFGTGRFTTMLEEKALKKNNPIVSSIQHEPEFLLVISINIAIEQTTAMIGKSHNTPPLDRKVYKIPNAIDLIKENDFTVNFEDWEIRDIRLNGTSLDLAE